MSKMIADRHRKRLSFFEWISLKFFFYAVLKGVIDLVFSKLLVQQSSQLVKTYLSTEVSLIS